MYRRIFSFFSEFNKGSNISNLPTGRLGHMTNSVGQRLPYKRSIVNFDFLQQAAAPYSRPMAWGTYMLRKLVCVGFHWFRVLARSQCLWLIGGPGGGSRLLHPIHGRGAFQHSNIISNSSHNSSFIIHHSI
jgi:hypothetical protein